ncbi:MAG: hypothetical protein GDA50_04215 [Alphaproteobacteria bacterium GM202ARS2]|nr:hypothetical protein [Alphaproteobacteria bacterium GM202ARS2]
MPLTPLQLPYQSNRSKFGVEGDARLVNGFAEELGVEGKSRFALYPMAGLSAWGSLLRNDAIVRGAIRALLPVGQNLYAVIGTNIVAFDKNRTGRVVGSVAASGDVFMRANRRRPHPQIGVVSGGVFNVIDTNNNSFVRVDVGDGNLPPATGFDVLDGYGIIALEGDRWIITNADDFTTINLTDLARAEASPDVLVRPFAFNRQLWLMGGETTEIWQNVGGTDASAFPFSRTTVFQLGCLAPNSVVNIDEKLLWVAHDGTVRLSTGGYSGQRISNHGVERAIKADANPDRLTATGWTDEGHHFYALSGTDFTYQFDLTTGWAERTSANRKRWRIDHVTQFDGMLIAGDIASGELFEMSSEYDDEADDPLIMRIGFPPTHAWPARVIFNALYVDIVAGRGAAMAREPELIIRWSDDGGRTIKGSRRKSMGRQGQTQTRVKINRLGMQRRNARQFELILPAATRRGVIGASADIEVVST